MVGELETRNCPRVMRALLAQVERPDEIAAHRPRALELIFSYEYREARQDFINYSDRLEIDVHALCPNMSRYKESVEAAICATAAIIAEAERRAEVEREAAWRASFVPHAYLHGSQNRPSQLFIYGVSGGAEKWLKIPLDLSMPPVTFAAQALTFVKKTPQVPFFGSTTGFIVNYTPDHAVRFDIDGNPVEHFDGAYRPGEVELLLRGRKIPTETFAKVMGVGANAGDQ